MKWRLILLETHNAFTNMAIDEAVSESVALGESLPTIRFYKWLPSAVSIGYFQSLKDEVFEDVCKRKEIDVVRRRTGGGAVFHDSEGEITYSVIAPEQMFSSDILKSYHEICNWIIDALSLIGIKSDFRPINDIVVNSKKISGNAQTRRNKVLLQHGTILNKVDVDKMFSVLKVGKEKVSDKIIQNIKKIVTSVEQNSNAGEEELVKALRIAFMEGKDFEVGFLTEKEVERTEQLVKEKYSTNEWNYKK